MRARLCSLRGVKTKKSLCSFIDFVSLLFNWNVLYLPLNEQWDFLCLLIFALTLAGVHWITEYKWFYQETSPSLAIEPVISQLGTSNTFPDTIWQRGNAYLTRLCLLEEEGLVGTLRLMLLAGRLPRKQSKCRGDERITCQIRKNNRRGTKFPWISSELKMVSWP